MHQTIAPRPTTSPGLGWFSLATGIATLITFAIAVTTPPRSGPFCTSDCIGPPYTDAAQFVPRDYVWMYPALVVAVLFLGLLIAIEAHAVAAGRVVLSRTATGLATIATATLAITYGLQLTVAQPKLARGETDGLGLLTQYNPDGLFIGLENVGYTAMALAFLLMGLAIKPSRRPHRVLRWILVIGGFATVVALVVFSVAFGTDLSYRYEVTAIALTWLTLALAAATLAWQHLRPALSRAGVQRSR